MQCQKDRTILKYPVIIFDCDGVILDSNHLKSDAMGEAVAHYGPELVARFVSYHKENGGISRYEKFDYFLKKMVKKYTEEEYKNLLSKLSGLVKAKLVDVPPTKGAFEFIERACQKSDLYIVSGGDQSELREVFGRRDMAKYFKDIFGSPTSKIDHCKNILRSLRHDESALLIGDSRLDYLAAKSCGFDFVFISGYTDMEHWHTFCSENSLKHFPDLHTLSASSAI